MDAIFMIRYDHNGIQNIKIIEGTGLFVQLTVVRQDHISIKLGARRKHYLVQCY